MTSEPVQEVAKPSNATLSQPPQGQTLKVDASKLVTDYTNFFRVTGTPEEVVIDFGLQPQIGGADEPVVLNQRIIMNFHSAKRLMAALHMTVERHEAVFGVLETDIQKRAQSSRR